MDLPNIWAEIDLDAIAHNVRELRRITRPQARLMAVVKADGYGHGADAVAGTALANGADMLAVARIDEGVQLRRAGLEAPILVMGPTFPAFAERIIANDLIQGVTCLEDARGLAACAARLNRVIPVHLKVDSGMGRLGLVPDCGGPGIEPAQPLEKRQPGGQMKPPSAGQPATWSMRSVRRWKRPSRLPLQS